MSANCWHNGACGRRSAAPNGEPAGLDVEEHESAVITTAGEIEAGDELQIAGRHVAPRSLRSEKITSPASACLAGATL